MPMKTLLHRSLYTVFALCLLTTFKAVPAWTADATVYDQRFDLDEYCRAGDPRCLAETETRYADWIAANRWRDIFIDLRNDFANSDVDWSGEEDIRSKFLAEMDSLIAECAELPETSDEMQAAAYYDLYVKKLKLARFRSEDNDSADVVFFRGNMAHQIMPSYVTLTSNMQDSLAKNLTEEQTLDLRLRANTIDLLGQMGWKELIQINLNAVRNAEARWVNYLDRGFSQYPWEASLNGWLTEYSVESPPGHQFILLHPDGALELGPLRAEDATVKEALTLALLGWVNYYGAGGDSFWGFSCATSFRDDMGIGAGGLLYFGSTASIGLMWHDRNRDDRLDGRPFLSVSIDLFRLAGVKGGGYLEKTGLLKLKRETLEKKVAELEKDGS